MKARDLIHLLEKFDSEEDVVVDLETDIADILDVFKEGKKVYVKINFCQSESCNSCNCNESSIDKLIW